MLVKVSDVKYLTWNMTGALALCAALLFVRNEAAIYAAVGVLGFAMACVFATFYAVATKAVPENANEVAGLMIMAISAGAVSGPVCGAIVRARTVNQQRLVKLYDRNDLLFAVGPAGSGKTYTAIALAVRALKERQVRRIILTRPAVEAGEKLGFLPGDMKEKLDPYLQPLYDALNDMIPPAKLQKHLEEGTVQIAPLAYMRGRTLDNAFVILDEAQNTTLSQIKMFLTRMGRNARFIVTGDVTQIDLPRKSDSGLVRTMEILRGVDGIGIVEFDKRDIVRHPLVKHIVEAFDRSVEKDGTGDR